MNLGIFFSIGGSLKNLENLGQLERFYLYLKKYAEYFEKIYIFSYNREKYTLPKNCILISNRHKLHRYLYTILLPIIEKNNIKKCNILKITQITGAMPGVICKFFYKIPYIATYGYDYSGFADIEGQKTISKIINLLMPVWLKFADKIIVTNKRIQSRLSKIKQKTVYIPNGVDINLFMPSKRKSNNNNILFVGRLSRQKNLILLIEAVNLSIHKKNITLTFVGNGPEREKLISKAKNSDVRLNLLDFVPHKSLPKIYNENAIFVLPSLIEGHPKALLEAMSAGLSCITTKSEGSAQIIKNNRNGLLVDNNNPHLLSSAIDMLLDNAALCKKLSLNARKYIEKNYSLNVLLEKEIKLLNGVANDK